LLRWSDLSKALSEETENEWEFYIKTIRGVPFHSLWRYLHYFRVGFGLFLKRSDINQMLTTQQFYGLIFAFFCRLFHVKKTVNVVVLSFIYQPKYGIVGKIYNWFIQFIVTSKYVDRFVVHSKQEVKLYTNLLGMNEGKIAYCLLGVTNESEEYSNNRYTQKEDFFVLSVGNSNRDFKFIEESLVGESYKVKIYTDTYKEHTNKNVICNKSVSVSKYFKELAECFCVIISLQNPNISSGQLVLLQSYAFGKPVIITSSTACEDYIDELSAIVIEKESHRLLAAISELMNNKKKYETMCKAASNIFLNKFSLFSMGKRLGVIFNSIE
jgi:glycosyltransferase involved in cell wall biosynthesis